MEITFDSGIVIQNNSHKLILDPTRKQKEGEERLVGISHAHSDHVKNHEIKVLSTKPSTDLFYYDLDCINKKYGEAHEFDGMEVKMHDANHILGSSQFEVTDGEETVVYTGDFRLNESMFFNCHIPEQADTLIVESTYGKPEFKFPDIEEVSHDVEEWVKLNSRKGNNILFGAYSLGKSQEIIKILNEMGIEPIVHPRIKKLSDAYNKNGFKLKYISSETEEGRELSSKRFVSVVPHHLLNLALVHSLQENSKARIVSALLTGWSQMYRFSEVDKVFPLSDHADFHQTMDYIEQVKPKQVYTVHGYEKELALQIQKKLNIPSRPLKPKLLNKWVF